MHSSGLFFLLLCRLPFHKYTTFCFSSTIVRFRVVPCFWLLWLNIVWTSLYVTFGVHKHSFVLVKYPGVEFLDQIVYAHLALIGISNQFFLMGCTILHFQQQMQKNFCNTITGFMHLVLCRGFFSVQLANWTVTDYTQTINLGIGLPVLMQSYAQPKWTIAQRQ
jgi:hypothetical protein